MQLLQDSVEKEEVHGLSVTRTRWCPLSSRVALFSLFVFYPIRRLSWVNDITRVKMLLFLFVFCFSSRELEQGISSSRPHILAVSIPPANDPFSFGFKFCATVLFALILGQMTVRDTYRVTFQSMDIRMDAWYTQVE